MTTILAIDTATDACSVALYADGEYTELYETIPRQHSRRLMPMLEELIPGGDLRSRSVDAIAYGCGPGSFTGLRIAASAVQGLAYANDLPAIPVSTLACQVQTAVRLGKVCAGDRVLSMLDARINEVYWSVFTVEDALVGAELGPFVGKAAAVSIRDAPGMISGVGGGFKYLDDLSAEVRSQLSSVAAQLLPAARDIVPLALEKYARGDVQAAQAVLPVYVRNEISWKKLAEQGKPA